MNLYYANGTPIINSLKVTSEVPLDPRLYVQDLTERDALVTNHIAHDLMRVHVKSNDTIYIYYKDTNTWEQDNKFTDEEKDKLNNIDTYITDVTHEYGVDRNLIQRKHIYNPSTDVTDIIDYVIDEARVEADGTLYNGLLSQFYVNRLNNVTNYLIKSQFTFKNQDLYHTITHYNPDTNEETIEDIMIPEVTHVTNGVLIPFDKIKIDDIEYYISSISLRQAEGIEELGINYVTTNPNTQTDTPGFFNLPLVTDSRNGLISPEIKHWIDNAKGLSNTGTTSQTWQLQKSDIDTRLDPNGGVVLKNVGGKLEVRNATDTDYAPLTVDDLVIKGDVTQEGTTFITEAETVEIHDNMIMLNRGETGAGVTAGVSGLEIDRGSLPNYYIVFDESDKRFKAGEEGDLWCLALRDDDADMLDGYFTSWNAANKRLETTNIIPTGIKLYFGNDDYYLTKSNNSGIFAKIGSRNLDIYDLNSSLNFTTDTDFIFNNNISLAEDKYLLIPRSVGQNKLHGVVSDWCIYDIRNLKEDGTNVDWLPTDMYDASVTPLFHLYNSPASWISGLVFNGWSAPSYASWEIAGPANTNGIYNNIWYRTSDLSGNWNAWETIASESWTETQLEGYLPLTAGANKPLTGLLYAEQGIYVGTGNAARAGIGFYNPTWKAWQIYMSNVTTTTGLNGIKAPSGSYVTSWALRSAIENNSGYGWTWESGDRDADPTIIAELSSNTGNFHTIGLVRADDGVQIGSTTDIGWYNDQGRIVAGYNVARGVDVGSLLVSNTWSEYGLVPTNGIYSKGIIRLGKDSGLIFSQSNTTTWSDIDNTFTTKVLCSTSSNWNTIGAPAQYAVGLNVAGNSSQTGDNVYRFQLSSYGGDKTSNSLHYRSFEANSKIWGPWNKIITQTALDTTLGNYLPLSGGTMTGNIFFGDGLGIFCGTHSLAKEEDGLIYLGSVSTPTVIQSNASDLRHSRNNTVYNIWDAYNLPENRVLRPYKTFTTTGTPTWIRIASFSTLSAAIVYLTNSYNNIPNIPAVISFSSTYGAFTPDVKILSCPSRFKNYFNKLRIITKNNAADNEKCYLDIYLTSLVKNNLIYGSMLTEGYASATYSEIIMEATTEEINEPDNNYYIYEFNIADIIVATQANITEVSGDLTSLTNTVNTLNTNFTQHQNESIRFYAQSDYVAARFRDSNLATSANSGYIEWWQSGAGWFNFRTGYLLATGYITATGLLTGQQGVQIGTTADYGWYLNNNRICAGINAARGVNAGSLLVSSAWSDSDSDYVPTNGIYSKGIIKSNAYFLIGNGNNNTAQGQIGYALQYGGEPIMGLGSLYSSGSAVLYSNIRPKDKSFGFVWTSIYGKGIALQLDATNQRLLLHLINTTSSTIGADATTTSYPIPYWASMSNSSIPALYDKVIGINGSTYSIAGITNTTLPRFYAPTSVGSNGQVLTSNGSRLTWNTHVTHLGDKTNYEAWALSNWTSSIRTGILVKLPFKDTSGKMVQFEVKIYGSYEITNIIFSCYLYNSNGGYVYSPEAVMSAGTIARAVKMGSDSEGNAYVWIGGSVDYAGVAITDIVGGFTTANWSTGWEILLGNDGSTITDVRLNTTVYPPATTNQLTWDIIEDKPVSTIVSRNLTINGTAYTFYSSIPSAAATIYSPTTAGTSSYLLQSTGGTPTWVSQTSIYAGALYSEYPVSQGSPAPSYIPENRSKIFMAKSSLKTSGSWTAWLGMNPYSGKDVDNVAAIGVTMEEEANPKAFIACAQEDGTDTSGWTVKQLATTEYVDNVVAGGSVDLSNYVTKTELNSTLSSYATQSWVTGRGYLTSSSLSGYATQSWVQQQGYLTSIPSNYVTDSELTATLGDYHYEYYSNPHFLNSIRLYISQSGTTGGWARGIYLCNRYNTGYDTACDVGGMEILGNGDSISRVSIGIAEPGENIYNITNTLKITKTNATWNSYTLATWGSSDATSNHLYTRTMSVNGTSYSTFVGTSNTTLPTIYAPTTVGTNKYVLQSNGSGAPSWINPINLIVGKSVRTDSITDPETDDDYEVRILTQSEYDALSTKSNYTIYLVTD